MMPAFMRPAPIPQFTPAPDQIENQLMLRWPFHQTAAALGFPTWCPRQRCRRRQACLAFDQHADYAREPLKLYPVCIQNGDAAKIVMTTIIILDQRIGDTVPDDLMHPDYRQAFQEACRALLLERTQGDQTDDSGRRRPG